MKIGLLGSKGTTLDILQHALSTSRLDFSHVFSISRELAEKNKVAYYQGEEIAETCRNAGIAHSYTNSYNLSLDHTLFADNGIEFLAVIGWERIIPDEVLRSLKFGAAGMHGSPFGLPRGRGRSPMNWSIITGHNRFVTYLFQYTPGMDDGPIFAQRAFEINAHDTIGSLHAKNRIVMGQLLEETIGQLERGELVATPQPDANPSYYPKRSREDGRIDWTLSTDEIHRLVRAVAPPYPGARASLDTMEIEIPDAVPFDKALFATSVAPGTVVDVLFSQNQFIVKTADGTLLVREYRCSDPDRIRPGVVLAPFDSRAGLADIRTRYPDFVADDEKEI